MIVLSSHGPGLTPDTSSEDGAARTAAEMKNLQTASVQVPSGHGRGLTPDTSSGAS